MDSHSSAGLLVGRETELGHLDSALTALEGGQPHCLTVEGEPGIGKTRLLGELRARAEQGGHVVLAGAAAEFERGIPFSVWVDALVAFVLSQDLPGHDSWDDELAAELGQVLPSLARGTAGGPGAGAVADERYRAHRAVSRLLTMLSTDRPLVLLLDDLHWADGASIELIAALVRRPPPAPVLLALGFRPGQVAEELMVAWTAPSVTRLELGQLSEADAVRLLDGVAPAEVASIYRQGGGNPFYLEQLGRSGTGPTKHTRDGDGVPAAVAASIAGELASLAPASRALLDGAAVAGEPFEPGLAAAVAEMPEPDGLAALDDLLELDLVRPTAVPSRFRFRHPLVRSAVYESTRGGWRLAAHARAAEALEAGGADPSELASHVDRCATRGDERAIAVLLEAGRAAASRAPGEAVRWFEGTLRLLPASDTSAQVEVRAELASALRSAGRLERCRATLLEALDLLGPDAVARRVELTTACAAVEHWQGRHDDAHRRLTRAWQELPDPESPEAAALELELAADGLYTLDFDQSLHAGSAALATARKRDDMLLIASAAAVLALIQASAGRMQEARAHRDEAVQQLERLSDDELAPRLEALFYLGWAETYLDLYSDSLAHVERAIEVARATGAGQLLVPLMLVRGFPLQMQGRLVEALEMAETAVEVARLSGNPHYLYWALFEQGWAHYYLGDLDRAIASADESLSVDSRLLGGTLPSAGGGPGWVRACSQMELGRAEEARAAMRDIVRADLQVAVQRCFDLEVMALAEVALGDLDGAGKFAAEAEADAGRLGTNLSAALAARARAAVLLAEGDAGAAAASAAESVTAAGAIGAALQVAFARALHGRALAAAGDRVGAIAVLREAERELDSFGSVRVRDETRRELRKLGARVEPRGRATAEESGMGALTARELEIAELITDRMTNAQIAEKLFLSKKTIESHIRNLFMKLSAGSRVEVARIVEAERRAPDAA